MKKIVMLDYTFLIDPVETWQHLFQFEKSFSDFLAQHGMEAQIVNPLDGSRGRRILAIGKKEEVVPVEKVKMSSPKDQIKNLKGKI